MTAAPEFLSDAELIRRLNLPEKIGRRALTVLDAGLPNLPRFPRKDPRFGNRRFFPAVTQWLNDYYGVRLPASMPEAQVSIQPQWEEHFDAPKTPNTRRLKRSGLGVA